MSSLKRAVLTSIAVFASASVLGACLVGPNYKGPPTVGGGDFADTAFHRTTGDVTTAAPPPARWWRTLNDPILNDLIDQALADSPSVRQARDKMRAARASLGESRAKLLPSGGATVAQVNARIPNSTFAALTGSGGSGFTSLDLYTTGFDATWELDIFGGARRGVEAAKAQLDASRADLSDAQVELAADVAQAYINLRDAQSELALAEGDSRLRRQSLDLTQQKHERGAVATGDTEREQATLDQSIADVAPLRGNVEQDLDKLAVLTGRRPGALDALLGAPSPVPTPPESTPIGDPAALLRRRPDIRAAERRLAAANAEIGKSVADLFPKVSLIGDLTASATKPGQLFNANSVTALGAPYLSWNIFNYPRIHSQIASAKADRDTASAQYERTVLGALQDAEASLSRFGRQRESLASLAAAETSVRRAYGLVQQRYQSGAISLIDMLDTQRQLIQTQRSLIQGQAQLTTDYVALQKSLGLGWEDAQTPPSKTSGG